MAVEEILDNLILKSIHFRAPDKSSHVVRPAILFLLTEFSKVATQFNQLDPSKAGAWSAEIQASVLKVGALTQNRKQEQLLDLCNQIMPAMKQLRKGIKNQEILNRDYDELIATILSGDLKIPENARICACYILKSYGTHDINKLKTLKPIVIEGAENNFSLRQVFKIMNGDSALNCCESF